LILQCKKDQIGGISFHRQVHPQLGDPTVNHSTTYLERHTHSYVHTDAETDTFMCHSLVVD